MSRVGTWHVRTVGTESWLAVALVEAHGVVRATVREDGEARTFEIRPGNRRDRVIVDGRPMSIEWRERGDVAGRLVADGASYEIEIETSAEHKIRELGIREVAEHRAHEIRAPMPGLLVTVHVAEGDRVRKGAPLAIIEAMKMENEITAPGDGVVTRVSAEAGSALEQGVLICRVEPEEDRP